MNNKYEKQNITRYVDTNGNIYRYNENTGVIKQVNCLRWVFVSKEDFDGLEVRKISKDRYNNLLNKYFKTAKIEWEHNGDKFRVLDCIETNNFGNINNYQFYNDTYKNTNDDLPKLPWFPIDSIYGYGFIAMFRGIVGYVCPYTNGGYQFLDIKTKEFKQWVTLRNLRPIMNMTTKKLVGETKISKQNG